MNKANKNLINNCLFNFFYYDCNTNIITLLSYLVFLLECKIVTVRPTVQLKCNLFYIELKFHPKLDLI